MASRHRADRSAVTSPPIAPRGARCSPYPSRCDRTRRRPGGVRSSTDSPGGAARGGTIGSDPGTTVGAASRREETMMSTRRVRVRDLAQFKERGEKWAMLTSYDQYTAAIFDQAGIPVLLVGDSAANNVYGYQTTLPVTVAELVPLVRAEVGATELAMDVGYLPVVSLDEGTHHASRTLV